VTPAARYAAAIEVVDQVNAARGPADEVLKAWGRNHRFAGSKDRKALAEIVYSTLRARGRSTFTMGSDDARALVLGALRWSERRSPDEIAALFSGEAHAPEPLSSAETARIQAAPSPMPAWAEAGVPEWIATRLQDQLGEAWLEEARAAILPRAPLDLRVNTLRGDMPGALRLLAHEAIEPEQTSFSALGLRLGAAFARDVKQLRAYTSGWIEVQDEGSQIVSALAGARPGHNVGDYCAGGGGKTLALGAAMEGRGRLIASDINPKRLEAMGERLLRAGLKVEARRLGSAGEGMDDLTRWADLVFVDAPCSGSGTWRRHPESAWRLTPETVERLSALQSVILERAARLVKPGGRLVYVTCSLLEAENERVAKGFARAHPNFAPRRIADAVETPTLRALGRDRLVGLAGGGHTLQLTPHTSGTDGFFAALFERSSA